MPSFQVCSVSGSSLLPHFWNQVPPRAQQLGSLSVVVPHEGHAGSISGIYVIDFHLKNGFSVFYLKNISYILCGSWAGKTEQCKIWRMIVCYWHHDAQIAHVRCSSTGCLQASIPSAHVCSVSESSLLPQVWNHDPSRAQQLRSLSVFVPQTWQMLEVSAIYMVEVLLDEQQQQQCKNVFILQFYGAAKLPSASWIFAQAWMPSAHVCSTSGSSLLPQFRNHEPPEAQQLRSSVSLTVPHTEHSASVAVEVYVFRIIDIQAHTQHMHVTNQHKAKSAAKNRTRASYCLFSSLNLVCTGTLWKISTFVMWKSEGFEQVFIQLHLINKWLNGEKARRWCNNCFVAACQKKWSLPRNSEACQEKLWRLHNICGSQRKSEGLLDTKVRVWDILPPRRSEPARHNMH